MYLDLSNRQVMILEFLKQFLIDNGYPPTVREICKPVGLSSTSTVHSHLNKLEKLGYIKRDPTKPRALEILDGRLGEVNGLNQEMINLPQVGCIRAGEPIIADENIEEYIPLPSSLVIGTDNFILKVKGDSMINAGILEGDYVVVDKKDTALNSQIVVALINNDSATVKRFFREDNKIRLQPENDFMNAKFFYENEINIIGIVTGVFRIIK